MVEPVGEGLSCLILSCKDLRSLTSFIVLLLFFSPAVFDENVSVIVSIDEDDAVAVEALVAGFDPTWLVVVLLLLTLLTDEELLV